MRLAMMFVALAAISAESYAAMSLHDIRREARFLTDRMGHELGLSNRQYNDVYEINFDFLYQVNEVIDDVVYGYDDAIDYYYYLLDVRNEDLMYVLRSRQYRRFVNRDYFYRPIYMVGRTWGMRIWDRYHDRNYFYFSMPTCYHTYIGAHYRIHFTHSYYAGMYHHTLYHGAFRLWGGGFHHHHHDGWHSIGKKKHMHPGSRPWGNAKNYEKSRRDLKAGYVNIPSRNEGSRRVKVDSEENRRTVMTSDTPTRTGSSRAEGTSSRSTSTVTRSGNTSSSRRNDSGVSTSTRNSGTTGTTRTGNSNSTSTRRSTSGTSVKSDNSSRSTGSSSSSRSSSSSVSSSRSSSSNKSSVSSGSSRSSSSRSSSVSSGSSRSSSSNKSSVSSGSSRSSSSRSSSVSSGSSRSSSSNKSSVSSSSSRSSSSRSSSVSSGSSSRSSSSSSNSRGGSSSSSRSGSSRR